MVLINELTVEQINAALLHLQRSKDEVVGGNKGTTIQNISISNSGGGGNNVDYSGTIKNLATNIEKNKTAIEKNASDIAKLKSDMANIEKSVEDTLQGLVDNGISDLSFDPLTKQLTITTNDGDIYQAIIEQDIGYLSYDSATNKLILTTGNQSQEITLPYIKASEKGSANGVATLDENGRVPYSQLPESAGQVSSVNGQSGAVVLTATDIEYSTGVSIKDKIDANAVQADWNVTDTTSLAYIKNKPTIPSSPVQSDWNVTDTTSLAYIKNKPTIPSTLNMNAVSNANDVSVAQNTVCRKIIMTNTITNVGCRTRVGIGLQRGTGGWGTALLSVGTNDAGTTFYDYKFSNTGVLTAACFCGPANWVKGDTMRPANSNLYPKSSNGSLTHFLSTFSMTTGKPSSDGHIIHMSWDNTGGWGAQLFLSSYNSTVPQYRSENGGTWSSWHNFITSENISTQHVACADSATSAGKASFLDLVCDCSDYWWDIPAFLTVGTCTAAIKACCVDNRMKYQLSTGTLRVNCIDLQCPGGIPSLIGFEEIACYPGGRLYRLGCSSIYRFKNELTCTVGYNLYDSIAAALQTAFGYNIWTDCDYGVGAMGSRCFCANGCSYRCTITGVHVSPNWVTICGLFNCVEASRTQTSCVYSGCLDFIFLGK